MNATLALLVLLASADGGSGALTLGPPAKGPAMRVVTAAPSLTELVLALGAPDRLVGVSRFDEAPEVKGVARIGGFNDPSIEAVATLKPDLAIVQKAPTNQKPVEALARLGVRVLALPLTSVADVEDACVQVGRALGLEAKGQALAAELEKTRSEVRARAAKRKPVRVLLVVGFAPLVVAGPGSYVDELLADVGAKNLALKAPSAFPTFSAERAVALAPDVIIDAANVPEGREKLQAMLPKAKWVKVPSFALLHPGPALGKALLELEALVAN
jgi:iron complex transport system substrate-binding protein